MGLVDRAMNIITKPKDEWQVVANEEPNTSAIITGYAVPLILLGTIGTFVGYGIIGLAGYHTITWGIARAGIYLVVSLLGLYVSAMVNDALAQSFGSEKNFGRSLQLVAYSMTPAWIAGIFNVLPFLGLITWVGSLYGIYLIYLGMPIMKKTPQDKVIVYMIVSWLVNAVIVGVVTAILVSILTAAIIGTAVIAS